MSDQEMTPESQTPEGGVSQDVADAMAALRTDAQSMSRAASRSWKVTAVVFIVVLLVVTTYLAILRGMVARQLRPGEIVELGVEQVNAMLAKHDAPGLTSGELPDWATKELKERAPSIVEQYIRPELERLPQELPELRQQLVEQFRNNSGVYVDRATDWLIQNAMPAARSRMVDEVKQTVSVAMDELDQQLQDLVAQVITEHRANIADLEETDWPALRRGMEQEFEREFGPILDEMFAGIDQGIQSTKTQMANLLADYQAGRLTYEQKLEIQLIRLVDALITKKALEPEEEPESLMKRAGEHLIQKTGEMEEAAGEAEPAPQTAPSAAPAMGPDLSQIPEEQREKVRKDIEKAQQAAQEAE